MLLHGCNCHACMQPAMCCPIWLLQCDEFADNKRQQYYYWKIVIIIYLMMSYYHDEIINYCLSSYCWITNRSISNNVHLSFFVGTDTL